METIYDVYIEYLEKELERKNKIINELCQKLSKKDLYNAGSPNHPNSTSIYDCVFNRYRRS